jgi:hypothetical protein
MFSVRAVATCALAFARTAIIKIFRAFRNLHTSDPVKQALASVSSIVNRGAEAIF